MEELKTLFGDNSLSYGEFEQKLAEAGETIKLANLKSGNYVDKAKYEKLEKNYSDYKSKFNEDSANSFADLQKQYDEVNEKYADLLKKQDLADKMNLISKSKVDTKFAEFVYSKVIGLTDDKKDFQTALTEYLKDNEQFLVSAKNSTFVDLQNGGTEKKSANEKMNDFIRRKGK